MKIAFISFWSCPLTRLGVLNAGGMSVYILNLSHELAKLGWDIDIYTRAHKEGKHIIVPLHKKVRVIHIECRSTKGDVRDQLYDCLEDFSVKTLSFMSHHNLKYNILYSHYFYSGLVGIHLKTALKIPLIQTFHTLGRMKEFYTGVKDQKRINSEEKVIAKVDSIISSTELEKDDLIKRYHTHTRKIFVIPPGVNHHLFKDLGQLRSRKRLGISQRKKIILFVGRIDPLKGIHLLIRAIAQLSRNHPNFENNYQVLLIGGDIGSYHFWQNPEVIKIKNLIKTKNLDCCVKFIGSKPHHLLPFYYSSADVVVMPSVYESFGLVVLEAMACGRAVLASRVGGLKYLINDNQNGRLFNSGNTNQCAALLWELLNNDKERKRLGANALRASQNFCWDKQAKKMNSIFEKYL